LQRAAARVTYDSRWIATVDLIYRYEGRNHALGGARLPSFMVFDLNVRRTPVRNTDVFVGVENLFDRQYIVNVSGPLQYVGLPRTLRGGVSLRSF
jgi:outer membrane receptor protein involved in Fe transport